MIRIILLIIAIGLGLGGCSQHETNDDNEKNTSVILPIKSSENATGTVITPSTEQNRLQSPSGYEAKNESGLSVEDFHTVYEMCVNVLNDYYKAVWSGSEIELDTVIDNSNLKRYTQKKIQSQYGVFVKENVTTKVENIEVGDGKVEYTEDLDGGFLYLDVPVEVFKTIGSYGESTEFIIRNVNGKLVIVDWYTGAKDSYDFLVRGENLTIDKPNIWNEGEWVKKLNSKQIEFSGSTR